MPNQRLASPSRQTTTDATLTTHSQSHSQAFAVEPPQRAFRFEPRRTRIDWRLLHGVNPDDVVRDMNIDALEGVLDTLTFGDIGADDVRLFTETNFRKLFRLSQLTVEYLLHVQDTLQTRNARMHKLVVVVVVVKEFILRFCKQAKAGTTTTTSWCCCKSLHWWRWHGRGTTTPTTTPSIVLLRFRRESEPTGTTTTTGRRCRCRCCGSSRRFGEQAKAGRSTTTTWSHTVQRLFRCKTSVRSEA